ncbi:MAG: GIN domain-containing protein [Janthinobacterium lividum]
MKTLPLLAFLLLFAPTAGWAQQSTAATPSRTETRALPSFTAIDVASGIELVIQPGQSAEAVVNASTAQFRRMTKTVVEGTTLKIYFDYQHEPNWQGLVHSREVFKVVVTTQELHALTAADGATVTLAAALTYGAAGALTVQLRSGASLTGAVQVQQLDMQLRGGSSARLTGVAATLHLRVTEGSEFRSPRLQADYCTAFASSASTARFAVRKTLDASAVNEATITYSGPAQLTQERHEQGGQISHF